MGEACPRRLGWTRNDGSKPSESMAALRVLLFVKRLAVALALLGCRIRVKRESEPFMVRICTIAHRQRPRLNHPVVSGALACRVRCYALTFLLFGRHPALVLAGL
jgi:hypothetical protein